MQQTLRVLPLFVTLLLAGCSMGPSTSDVALGPTLARPNPALATPQPQPTVAVTPASLPAVQATESSGAAMADVSSFLDAGAASKLNARERSEAASAQFNALTFGRPGAPRTWTGDKGTTGSVTVGPYVRVNNIDCRDFTHTVTIGGTPIARKGTACRDAEGNWSVAG